MWLPTDRQSVCLRISRDTVLSSPARLIQMLRKLASNQHLLCKPTSLQLSAVSMNIPSVMLRLLADSRHFKGGSTGQALGFTTFGRPFNYPAGLRVQTPSSSFYNSSCSSGGRQRGGQHLPTSAKYEMVMGQE